MILGRYEKIEQIALHVPSIDIYIKTLSKIGIGEWSRDEVTASGYVFGKEVKNSVAHLAFNYQCGYEFELLSYQQGNNWHKARGTDLTQPFLSHKGFHVENIEEDIQYMEDRGIGIAQELWTEKHTNEHVTSKNRTYHYCVFNTRDFMGFDLKLIQRIQHDG